MSYKVTTVEEMDALPEGTVVMDGECGLYRKCSAVSSANEWLDLDSSIHYGERMVEDSHTILWQTPRPHAFVLCSPVSRTDIPES